MTSVSSPSSNRNAATRSATTSNSRAYRYLSLAQASTEHPSSSNLNVFGVVTRHVSPQNNVLMIKDESNREVSVKLNNYVFDVSPMKIHYGDIIRMHRMRYNSSSCSNAMFDCDSKNVVIFEAFISKEMKKGTIWYESKNPTLTRTDFERAFELDQWYAQQLICETFSKLHLPHDGYRDYLNLFGKVVGVWSGQDSYCWLALYDTTKLSLELHKETNPDGDFKAAEAYHLIKKEEMCIVKVWDCHADRCRNLNPGEFVLLSNVTKKKVNSDGFKIELHGNLKFGKWARKVNSNSSLAILLGDIIKKKFDDQFFEVVGDIDLSSPLYENSQSQGRSQSTNSLTQDQIIVPDQIDEPMDEPVHVDNLYDNPMPSGSGIIKRRSDPNDDNVIQTNRKKGRKEYVESTNIVPISQNISEFINESEEHPDDSYCATLHNSSLEVENPSDSSATLEDSGSDTSETAINSIPRYLNKANENRPGSVIASVTHFYPGSKRGCLFIQDIVFIKCNCCGYFITIDQALGSRLNDFKIHYTRFISQYANEVEPEQIIPCEKCQSENTKILFHIPLRLVDVSKNVLWVGLSGEAANQIFETTPLNALCYEYARSSITQFFDQLRDTCEQGVLRRYTLLKHETIFEITSITDLADQSFNSSVSD